MYTRAFVRAAACAAPLVALLLLSLSPADAEPTPEPTSSGSTAHAHDDEPRLLAEATAQRARDILTGTDPAHAGEATLALRDLFVARPQLGLLSGLQAEALLARPFSSASRPTGRRDEDAYPARSAVRRTCAAEVCVHHTTKGRNAPKDEAYVRLALRTLRNVWRRVAAMGYRMPPADGDRGGDGRFDVYLTDLGERGLFGYCAPERRVRKRAHAASGYCVLDDDFSPKQYGAPQLQSLRVTMAHEFFHAVQFGYDYHADHWLMESTATWLEEELVDGADDNRRFLEYGALRRPQVPLDRDRSGQYAHYGNWVFWEFLSTRYGPRTVRNVWDELADRRGDDRSSIGALRAALRPYGGLDVVLPRFVTANLTPRDSYREGKYWPEPLQREVELGRSDRSTERLRVDHLAGKHVTYRPTGRLSRAELSIAVTAARHQSAVRVLVREADGRMTRSVVTLTRGQGQLVVPFDGRSIASVTVSLVNTSVNADDATFAVTGEVSAG